MTKNTLIFLLFFILGFQVNAQSSDSNQEQTILLQIKEHWSNPPSLSHWKPSSDHCKWPEINCTDGSVTKLEVKNQTIAGTIPVFICDLTNLTYIDLQLNSFSGIFPVSFYNCSNLEHLDISNNSFIGTIPDDINRLSFQLQFLSLGNNQFSGGIPPTIGSFQFLKILFLYGNLFNGSIPEEIGELSNLEKLDFTYNILFSPQRIPSSFSGLKKLKNLWMTNTNLIGEIPDQSIGNMSALEFVDLSFNRLNGSIPNDVFLLKNLSYLYLYNNMLSGSIPPTIETLNMNILDLSGNRLTGIIPDDIGKLTKLTGLALFFNNLSGEVPKSIGELPELVNLNLFSNNLSGELPPNLGRYSMLKRFQVSENQFVGALPEYLCANKVLLGVIAFNNKLTGELPQLLGDCSTLQYFWVHNNILSGKIPDGLWTSTIALRLSNNLFMGQLPSKLGRYLSSLEMGDNQFSGPIPADVSFWENLVEFKASNNLFSGVLPQELNNIPFLSTLSLDGNMLSGQLSSNIGSWKSLTFLNLSTNQLSGEIPASLSSLGQLSTLDLSRNEFSGQIPSEIGLLKLTSLNLSSNKLYGKIPIAFENSAFDSSFLNNPGLCANNRCNNETGRRSKTISSQFIAAVSSLAAVALIVAVLYTIFLFRSYRKKKLVLESNWKLTSFQRLNFTEANILSCLTDENVIGSGGSGKIYRVPIGQSGESVAVKKIWDKTKLDKNLEKEFLAEVQILGTIRHSNIVKLLCCISNEETKFLVYEYMENCSLDRWLHGKRRSPSSLSSSVHHVLLDWSKRLQIAVGAAQGLVYMHHECSPPLIHRDVKSSNILLDSDMKAKIADFGLAKMLINNGEPNTMSVMAGSFGYIAPEYSQTRRVNEKADIFSFGVVLLELVTGREAHRGDESLSLVEWSWRHIQENKPLVDALDEDIKESEYMDEIESVLNLGIICTSSFPSRRPTMKDVLQILLRCSQRMSLGLKKNINEFAPLLRNSKRERTLECDDSMFTPLV